MVKYHFHAKIGLHAIWHYNASGILHYKIVGGRIVLKSGPELLICPDISKMHLAHLEA